MPTSNRAGRGVLLPATFLAGVFSLVAGCHLDENPPIDAGPQVVALNASPDSVLLPAIGSTLRVTVEAVLSDSTEADVTEAEGTFYTSTNAVIAGAAAGVVRATGQGSAKIIVERDGVSDTISVTVDEDAPLALDLLLAQPSSMSLPRGATAPLKGIAVWANGARLEATGIPFTYVSSDDQVATASVNGLVEAVAAGNATITLGFLGEESNVPVSVIFPGSTVSFSANILPIFEGDCTFSGCHPGTGPAQRNLRLTSHQFVLAGGDSGLVVTPGNGAESRIILALRGTLLGTRQMPLSRPPLTEFSIVAIQTWIDEGALDN